ncbi:hypothetical protein J3F83DRAFT_751802 [Trichoderma novae-zelandiae]
MSSTAPEPVNVSRLYGLNALLILTILALEITFSIALLGISFLSITSRNTTLSSSSLAQKTGNKAVTKTLDAIQDSWAVGQSRRCWHRGQCSGR